MTDRSKMVFGNEIPKKAQKKAVKSQLKYIRKFGDNRATDYAVKIVKNECLNKPLGVYDIRVN